MSIGDYLFYSFVGICVVFCVLLLLMAVIKIMMYEPRAKGEPVPEGAAPAPAEAPAPPVPLAPGSAGDVKLYDTDPRDAALIMAIVADELKKPLNELRFISIREVRK